MDDYGIEEQSFSSRRKEVAAQPKVGKKSRGEHYALKCFSCKMKFDIIRHQPILTNCCHDICCKICWTRAMELQPFQCPIGCQEQYTDPQEQARIVNHIMRILLTVDPPSYITCPKHQTQYADTIENNSCKLTCKQCNKEKGITNKSNGFREFGRKQVNISIQYLEEQIQSIEQKILTFKQTIQQVKSYYPFSSSALSDSIDYIQRWNNESNLKFMDELKYQVEEEKKSESSHSEIEDDIEHDNQSGFPFSRDKQQREENSQRFSHERFSARGNYQRGQPYRGGGGGAIRSYYNNDGDNDDARGVYPHYRNRDYHEGSQRGRGRAEAAVVRRGGRVE